MLFSLISAALFYLGNRALITRWLWSRYPSWLTHLTDCAACTGFWWGMLLSLTCGRRWQISYLGLDPSSYLTPVLTGLCSLTLTPMVAGFMQLGIDRLGTIVEGS